MNYLDINTLSSDNRFGRSVCNLGDYNGDGHPEIAVGYSGDYYSKGGIYIVSMKSMFSVSTTQTNVSCFGESDGMLIANGTGSNPPYSYFQEPA